jgi:RHS repeat-associated protein
MRQRAAIAVFAVLLVCAAPAAVHADIPSKYWFDGLGRLASVTTELGTTKYRYFESGSIEEMVDPEGWRYSFTEGDAPATWATAAPNFLPSFATVVSSPLDQSANRFLFTGFMYERELGLYLTPSGRLYDPEAGRFIQQDSYLGTLLDPPSLHRYLYGHANPARFIDPTGHSDEDANRLAAAMHGRTGFLASDHRPAEQRGWWYNASSYVYQDLPPRLLPLRQFEGLARQDAKEFAIGTGETVLAALVPPAVKRGAGALVERFPVLGKSVTEAAGEALERLRPPAPAELPAPPVKTASVADASKSGGAFVATEEGRLAPAAPRTESGSQGADTFAAPKTELRVGEWVGREIRGRTVFQRSDIFDPLAVDDTGLTNVQRMGTG